MRRGCTIIVVSVRCCGPASQGEKPIPAHFAEQYGAAQELESSNNSPHRCLDFELSVALSNSATRASISSISIAFAE